MPTVKERLEILLPKLQKNADKLFIAGLGIVLLLLAYAWLNESSTSQIAADQIQQKELDVRISPSLDPKVKGSDLFIRVNRMVNSSDPFDKTPFASLGVSNMFDAKQIRDPDQLLADAKQLVAEARQKVAAGSLEEAKRLVKEALRLQNGFPSAKELEAEIEAKLKATPVPTPTPKAPAGAAKPAKAS